MELLKACIYTLYGTGFSFLLTSLGAATIFVVNKKQSRNMQSVCMGFAAGIMMASSIWSLLMPALELSEEVNKLPWLTVSVGFFSGGLCFYLVDLCLTYNSKRKSKFGKHGIVRKLFTVITLHNIPEGMAIGLSFALAVQEKTQSALVCYFL